MPEQIPEQKRIMEQKPSSQGSYTVPEISVSICASGRNLSEKRSCIFAITQKCSMTSKLFLSYIILIIAPSIFGCREPVKENGKGIIIQNSAPKGAAFTHADGKIFSYRICWTRVINETASPAELTINFPADSFAIFPQANSHLLKIFLLPNTMTPDKESLYNYWVDLKSFLDTAFYKPTMLHRTIHPKEECLFLVVLVLMVPNNGGVVTGLVLKGQDLFYSIRVGRQIGPALIPCGRIVFKK